MSRPHILFTGIITRTSFGVKLELVISANVCAVHNIILLIILYVKTRHYHINVSFVVYVVVV